MEKFVLLLLMVTGCFNYCSAANDLTYTAAVVEYEPILPSPSISFSQVCKRNVEKYIEILGNIKQPLDIVVFPEATVTTFPAFKSREVLAEIGVAVPDTEPEINPCDSEDFPEYIADISCAARKLKTYVVINTIEKTECATDPERDEGEECVGEWNFYNVNLIFDRNGNLIAKYRKFHLFHEVNNRHARNPEAVTFETDFGVTFGTFVCFDMSFEEPAASLLRRGVKHFVYPTMWFSISPFLTALQAQHMWAVSNDVVLLAANANGLTLGNGGSGIYRGSKGYSNMTIASGGGTKVIVADVYKNLDHFEHDGTIEESTEEIDRKASEMDRFFLHTDAVDAYESYKIDGDVDSTYCHGEFCCRFKVSFEKRPAESSNYYRFRAVVYSGVKAFFGPETGGIELCAVVFCKDDTVKSCAQRIVPYSKVEWPVTFAELEIAGTFDVGERKVQSPNTLLSSIEPMQSDGYEWTAEEIGDGTVERKIKLSRPQSRLLVFGIVGRDFAQDGRPADIKKYDKIEL